MNAQESAVTSANALADIWQRAGIVCIEHTLLLDNPYWHSRYKRNKKQLTEAEFWRVLCFRYGKTYFG